MTADADAGRNDLLLSLRTAIIRRVLCGI
jgi:hypothetical protein